MLMFLISNFAQFILYSGNTSFNLGVVKCFGIFTDFPKTLLCG